MLRTRALKINTDNLDRTVKFFTETLRFRIDDNRQDPESVVLRTGDRVKLILNKVKRLSPGTDKTAFTGLTLQVNDLDLSIAAMEAKEVLFAGEKRKVGVGQSIYILDPSGRRISLLQQTIVETPPFDEPKMYNFGVTIPDMSEARKFYSDLLGFVVRSEDYLPAALPLGHADGSFGFMLHWRKGIGTVRIDYPNEHPYYSMVFETDDLEGTLKTLKARGVRIVAEEREESGELRLIAIQDPGGLISEIVQSE